jgi:hypothetical protein
MRSIWVTAIVKASVPIEGSMNGNLLVPYTNDFRDDAASSSVATSLAVWKK